MNENFSNLKEMNAKYIGKSPEQIISQAINDFGQRIVYVSSFGTESAVVLHMISKIDKFLPVLLLNTHFLFDETLEYKNKLLEKLSLRNFKEIFPDQNTLNNKDFENKLWDINPDKCCEIRKVLPLKKELKFFDAWISGRKSYQSSERRALNVVEFQNNKAVINPLVNFSQKDVEEYFLSFDLPRHPLSSQGYLSIGCKPCTSKCSNVNDMRSGRWINQKKTECGIHLKFDSMKNINNG